MIRPEYFIHHTLLSTLSYCHQEYLFWLQTSWDVSVLRGKERPLLGLAPGMQKHPLHDWPVAYKPAHFIFFSTFVSAIRWLFSFETTFLLMYSCNKMRAGLRAAGIIYHQTDLTCMQCNYIQNICLNCKRQKKRTVNQDELYYWKLCG